MRRRTINNLKIAAVYSSLLFLGFTLRNVQKVKVYAGYTPEEVVHTIHNAPVDNIVTEPETETETETEYKTMIASRDWDYDDGIRLMKIAMAEAEGESTEGKALVMITVLNRVWSDDFPGSIEDVIFQNNQFTPVKEGGRYWTTEPDSDCLEALRLIESGWDESEGALYFESANTSGWIDQNKEYLFQQGNHKFFK